MSQLDDHASIDLRSDTVSMPSAEMLATITQAQLGDDIMGEDSSVVALETDAAELLGMEAGLLCVSGTMANQIAVMCLAPRGAEVVVGAESHIYNLEGSALAALSQVQARPISGAKGVPLAEDYERALFRPDVSKLQQPETGLICLENTYNLNAGRVVNPLQTSHIVDLASDYDIPVYLDGARIFNAAAALGVRPAELCHGVNAVQFCLTKGLGAPVGSILAGSRDFIAAARKVRQRLGGGMRQAGIIAAPGSYALMNNRDRLPEDHARARKLVEGLRSIDQLAVAPAETNIALVRVVTDRFTRDEVLSSIATVGIKAKPIGADSCRMVTHLGVTDDAVDRTVSVLRALLTASA